MRETHFHSAHVERFFIPRRLGVQHRDEALDRAVHHGAWVVTSICADSLTPHNTSELLAVHLTQWIAMCRTMYDAQIVVFPPMPFHKPCCSLPPEHPLSPRGRFQMKPHWADRAFHCTYRAWVVIAFSRAYVAPNHSANSLADAATKP